MSDLENHKKNMKELAETRKRKLSDSSGGAGTLELEDNEIKLVTFKDKWINYWYHYKFATIAFVISLMIVVFSIMTFIDKSTFDAGLAFVTETPFESNSLFVASEWKDFCDDSNEDGEVNINVFTAQLDVYNKYSLDPTMAEANVTRFMGNISLMGNFLYVVDEVGYNSLIEVGCILADLSNLTDVDLPADDNLRYPLKDTQLAQKVGLGNILDGMYLCIISYDDLPEKRQADEEITDIWVNDLAFLKNLVEYG